MKFKTAIASTVLALASIASHATTTSPTFVSGSFDDVTLGTISIDGTSNLTGLAGYISSFSTNWGELFLTATINFRSVALYLGSTLIGTSYTDSFSFANLATGSYSLKASGAVTGGGTGAAVANYQLTAVPEPETYAMLLAGLGLMGTMVRRRNKSAL